jgi:SAM-dependent methyltransferase
MTVRVGTARASGGSIRDMQGQPGFYERRIFPWLNDQLLAAPEFDELRAETLRPARGSVVEIGFGSGLNLPHYPAAVHSLTAIEPNPGMQARAVPRVSGSPIQVQVIAGCAESIPLPDAGFGTAVSVLTLCSVADPARALAELRRVLRDEGRLLVLEHGLAPDPGVARWQHRLNGLQRVLACGCNLDRPVTDLVRAGGFRFEAVRQFYAPGIPRSHGWLTLGSAVKA